MAKAIVLREHGNSNVLKLEDIEIKKPKENELLIRQTAIGVHFHDIYVRSGLYKTLKLPGIPGLEAVGIIEETGAGIEDFKKGDKIAYITKNYGAYSSNRILDKNLAVKIPNFISDEMMATNFSRAITVQMLIEEVTKLNASDTILITAAAGGVGRIFSQWAKSKGAVVIGTVGSKEKIITAKSYGCDHTLTYHQEDFIETVMELTNGKGVSVVYDGVGKTTYDKSIECLKLRGTMVSFGNASGPLDPIIVSKSLQPKGIYFVRPAMNQYFTNSEEIQEAANMLFKQISSGNVKIEIFKKYKLEDAVQAHKDLEGRKITGPAIIIP